MRILGVKVWRDRPTDEEFIEQLRKGLRIRRWLRWYQAVHGLAMLVLSVWALNVFVRALTLSGTPPGQQNLVYVTFGAAAVLGLAVGLWLAQAATNIASAFFDQRKDRMLVESWDAMNDLLDERKQAANQRMQLTGDARDGE